MKKTYFVVVVTCKVYNYHFGCLIQAYPLPEWINRFARLGMETLYLWPRLLRPFILKDLQLTVSFNPGMADCLRWFFNCF